jgi:hypothetical protein
MTTRETRRIMREAKAAGKPPVVSRDTTEYIKKELLRVLDEAIAEKLWVKALDDDRQAIRKQRDRVAKLFGLK